MARLDANVRGHNSSLTRRALMRNGFSVAVGALALASCDLLSVDPDGEQPAKQRPAADNGPEAPSFAQLVKDGQLPSVAERLPAEPLVIDPQDRVGGYGGTWNSALLGPADSAWLDRTIGYDFLVRWDVSWSEVIPNVALEYEVSDEGRTYTFRLRPGMKWSDGKPFTADDIVFAYDDVLLSPDMFPAGPPSQYVSDDGTPAVVEKVDDHTVRFVFTEPKALFLQELATPKGSAPTSHPKHYLKKFHPAYADNVDELVSAAGVSSWAELFELKRNVWENAEVPTVFAWRLTEALGTGSRVVAERNPYYWKTDTNESQLPYIDRVVYDVIEDPETILLRATNGEMDFHTRHINSMENKPVLARGRKEGGYDFVDLVVSDMNDMVIMFNLTCKEPVLRDIFRTKDFRTGLSYAINRRELIDAVYQQQGEPWQAAPRPESEFFDKEFAKQYTDYDVDLANRHLDRAGLVERDGDGYRLRPDGERLSIIMEVASPAPVTTWMASLELIRDYWRAVGVDMRPQSTDRSLWLERIQANEHQAAVWAGAGGWRDEILYAFNYLPSYMGGSRYAVRWAEWYETGGSSGEEPPEETRRQLELYDRVKSTYDEGERNELFREVLRISKEQFYLIGTVLPPEGYGILADDFENVPGTMPSGYLYGTPGPTRPEQYYITES